jgi:hypothetical protein
MIEKSNQEKIKFCSHCGFENHVNNKFCNNCGEILSLNGIPLQQISENKHPSGSKNGGNKSKLIKILVGGFVILLLLFVFSRLGNNSKGITYRAIENETTWYCTSNDVTIQSCSLPVNYTAETGISKVSVAFCNGGVWDDYSDRITDIYKLAVGVCNNGKCQNKYGTTGLIRLSGSNNSCPVGSWNY